MPTPDLILFAKTPIPGQVKTRLQPELSAAQAATVAEILLRQTIASTCQHWPGQISLWMWPTPDHPVITSLATEFDLAVKQQGPGNLGQKMHRASAFSGTPTAIIGCDVPHCPAQTLTLAYALLSSGHNIIGPSHDGGYYLIGLQRAQAALFADVEWGTDKVFDQTMDNAGAAGLEFITLPPLHDLDTFPDLLRHQDQLPQLAAWLSEIRQ